jgi:DNA repair protein REV1
MGVESCDDLYEIPKETLQSKFGNKIGEGLYLMSRAIDDRPITTGWCRLRIAHILVGLRIVLEYDRKSIGAEVNWGIRFTEATQVSRLLRQIVEEAVTRIQKSGMESLRVTVKCKMRIPGSRPTLYMGHGPCYNYSRYTSSSLLLPAYYSLFRIH